MNEEQKQVISFIFKRSGKKILPASDVYLAISMELQWCSPKQAKSFVKQSIAEGLLKENKEGVTPSFPVESISIPTGFSPSKDCFTINDSIEDVPSKNDLISQVISQIKQKTKMNESEIISEIQKIVLEKMIIEEVAAVFYAKKMDCEISQFIEKILTLNFKTEKNTT